MTTSWGCAFVVLFLANPRVPTQGYIPLGGMGTGWALDTQGFTPVLPYLGILWNPNTCIPLGPNACVLLNTKGQV